MKSKFIQILFGMAAAASFSSAQSTISTILGETPTIGIGVPATSVSLNIPAGVVSDGKGSVYVSLRAAAQVVRIDSSGTLYVVAGTGVQGGPGPSGDGGPAISATLSLPLGLTFDSSGNLYIADAGANKIRMVDTKGIIHTFAGNGNNANSGDGGPAINASMNTPSAIAFDNKGDLLIADTGNDEIRMVTPAGTMVKVAGIGTPAFDGDNGTVATAAFSGPTGLVVDKAGDIYVSDTGNECVRMISTAGITSVIAGTPGTRGSFGDGRQATISTLNSPGSIVFDTAGNLYIADVGNDRVRVIGSNGVISNYAGSGHPGADGDGGWAIAANLNLLAINLDPQNNMIIADGVNYRVRFVTASTGIINTIGGTGMITYNPQEMLRVGDTLYFSDSSANRIRKMSLTAGDSSVTIFAGAGTSTYDANDDVALTARLNGPRGLAIDSTGNIYFADTINNVVRRITPEGALTTVTGNSYNYDSGNGGPATAAQTSQPVDVAVAANGNLYILEEAGNAIRVVTPNGIINNYAGTGVPGVPSSPTGTATSQPTNSPQGLAIDSSGTLYYSNTGNNIIRKITTDGNVTTIAGNGTSGYSGDGGPALSAALRNPVGLTVDSYGNIFFADTRNDLVREVGTDGIISTVAGIPPATSPVAGYNGDGSPATSFSLNQPISVVVGPSCSILIGDTSNQRIRQVFPSVAYSVTTNPAGLQVTADGQTVTTPAILNWLPGTSHQLSAPSPQSGAAGTQYVLSSATQSISVACGAPRAAASVSFTTQYLLSVSAGTGGTVSQSSGFLNAGTSVTLTATPAAGYVFAGWGGACSGTGSCQVTMNSPESVSAQFSASQVRRRR